MPRRRVSSPSRTAARYRLRLSSSSPSVLDLDASGLIVYVRPGVDDTYWLGRRVANLEQLLWWYHAPTDARPAITQMPLALAIHTRANEVRLIESAYITRFEIL